MSKTLATLGASVLLCASQLAHAYLPGSVSGPFYNPEQSGHGITITVVDDQSAIAIWHVYNTDGDPLTLYIEGNVEGRRIVGQAYAPEGMRFGDFNSADVQVSHWGSVDIAFDDCDHATLSWVADDLAYGDGEMPIRRLVQPIGVECSLPTESTVPPGLYESDGYQGLIDDEGVLWGVSRKYESDGTPAYDLPGPVCFDTSTFRSFVVTPSQKLTWRFGDPRTSSITTWMDNPWLCVLSWYKFRTINEVAYAPEDAIGIYLHLPLIPVGSGSSSLSILLTPGSQHATLVSSLTLPMLAGRYVIRARDQFFVRPVPMDISENGDVCIKNGESVGECYVQGTIRIANEELGITEFRFTLGDHPSLPAYFGRGWMAGTSYGRELVLVGHPDGGKGFGLVAIKEE